jgi:hypothetical protein
MTPFEDMTPEEVAEWVADVEAQLEDVHAVVSDVFLPLRERAWGQHTHEEMYDGARNVLLSRLKQAKGERPE